MFMELMAQQNDERISYADFRRVKHKLHLPQRLTYTAGSDVNALFGLAPAAYPDVAELIQPLRT